MKKLTKEWIIKAEKDYLVATREIQASPLAAEAVCFHSQQCIEKYLKALLQEKGIGFEKIHDLDVLLQQCVGFLPDIENCRDNLVKLSTYAVDVRYPGLDVSQKEAKECVAIMIKVRKVIKKHLRKLEHKPKRK